MVYLKGSISCTVNLQKKMHNGFLLFLLLECTIYSLCASPDENTLSLYIYIYKKEQLNTVDYASEIPCGLGNFANIKT